MRGLVRGELNSIIDRNGYCWLGVCWVERWLFWNRNLFRSHEQREVRYSDF
jgi:hypothetical protein